MLFKNINLSFLAFALLFTSCNEKGTSAIKTSSESKHYELSEETTVDIQASKTIAPYKLKKDSIMDVVLNQSEMAMTTQQPESLLGNFVADLVLNDLNDPRITDGIGVDFCLLNIGGLRTALPKGDITRGKIFELMPFENELVLLKLPGEAVQELFNYIAVFGGQPIGGATLAIRNKKAIDIKIGGKAFDPNKSYVVATSDYLANGGDSMDFFKKATNRVNTRIKLRDAIIEHVIRLKEAGKPISAQLDGRIYYDK